jgi:hypothetical protein
VRRRADQDVEEIKGSGFNSAVILDCQNDDNEILLFLVHRLDYFSNK